jgi:hypothetical protein
MARLERLAQHLKTMAAQPHIAEQVGGGVLCESSRMRVGEIAAANSMGRPGL